MKKNFYFVAVVRTPKQEDLTKAAPDPEVILQPIWVFTASPDSAKLEAMKKVPQGIPADEIEVLVRPF